MYRVIPPGTGGTIVSRTYRHIPFWARYIRPWEKAMHRLYELGFMSEDWKYEYDPRGRLLNGYDRRKGQSVYFMHYGHHCGLKEEYIGRGRKFAKREYRRLRRMHEKRMINEEVWTRPPVHLVIFLIATLVFYLFYSNY